MSTVPVPHRKWGAGAGHRQVAHTNGAELARYDLSEDASTETAMVVGELYRNGAARKSAPSAKAASGPAGIARDNRVDG
ncbi:TerD family protein [Nocardia sp. NPDC051990]|uniref:TerD family protein n=1 Tax=Nocardia sp. NPDC051990 TaxID=3155285 RepID=UPI0034250FC2